MVVISDGMGSFAGNEDATVPSLFADVTLTATWNMEANGRGSGSISTSGSLVSESSLVF
jgi:hypothetical protein